MNFIVTRLVSPLQWWNGDQKNPNILDYALNCSVLASCDEKGINVFLWKWKPWKTFSKDQGPYLFLKKKKTKPKTTSLRMTPFGRMILHPLISLANLAQVLRYSPMTFSLDSNILRWTSAIICQFCITVREFHRSSFCVNRMMMPAYSLWNPVPFLQFLRS